MDEARGPRRTQRSSQEERLAPEREWVEADRLARNRQRCPGGEPGCEASQGPGQDCV
ncbi:hypothetical protein B0H10DRAFT_2038043 [Mycena sp. CBHHK59/15]|nr:hypothetical protein B0H10DRAFT_2062252 [Mycena sp. CBHHK59/15]KAJ6616263.1 hypothetical protein B0H10DRAFT_2038043 [Mycena sp. CBHHK59/15]